MGVLLVLLGIGIRLASIAASLYLLWNARWRVILMAIAYSFVTPALTALVNWPMGRFWKELGYPEALTTPGLRFLVNPWRLVVVFRLPQFVYGGLAYCIGLGVFLLFGSSSSAVERAAMMMAGYEAAFAVPTAMINLVSLESEARALFLSSHLFYGKMALLALLVVHVVTPLAFGMAAALLAAAMLMLQFGFEFAAARKPLVASVGGSNWE